MFRRILALALVSLYADAAADAQPFFPYPDDSFGTGGQVVVGFDLGPTDRDAANAAVLVPGSGTIFIVGQVEMPAAGDSDFGVLALREDGTPEPTFDGDGKLTVAMDFVPHGEDVARDVAWIPWSSGLEWRLVVVGEVERPGPGNRDFGIALLRPDGSLESAAAGGGRVAVKFDRGDDYTDQPLAVATDSAGRIVVAGPVDSGPGDTDWGFARLDSELVPDPTFGTGGKAVIDVSGLGVVRDVLVQPDGKILAVGTRDVGNHQILVVRLETDGSLDTSFGILGFAIIDPDHGGIGDDGFAIALWKDGHIAVVGQSSWTVSLLTIAKLEPNGTINNVISFYGPCGNFGRAVAIDYAGRMVVGSELLCDGNRDFFLSAIETNSISWYVPWDWTGDFSLDDRLTDLLLQPDAKVVAVGRVQGPGGDLDFGAVRILTEYIFIDGFESGNTSAWSLTSY